MHIVSQPMPRVDQPRTYRLDWSKTCNRPIIKCALGNPSPNLVLYYDGSDWLKLTVMQTRDELAMVIGARFQVSDAAARP